MLALSCIKTESNLCEGINKTLTAFVIHITRTGVRPSSLIASASALFKNILFIYFLFGLRAALVQAAKHADYITTGRHAGRPITWSVHQSSYTILSSGPLYSIPNPTHVLWSWHSLHVPPKPIIIQNTSPRNDIWPNYRSSPNSLMITSFSNSFFSSFF